LNRADNNNMTTSRQHQPGCESVNPYNDDGRGKAQQVRDMFDNIAPAYDFMNRAMTLGIDRLWRRHAVKKLAGSRPRYILDVASGTGDLAMLLTRQLDPISVTGVDLSDEMLEIGRHKVASAGLSDVIRFQQADCLSLPFTDRTFDCVTVAFGVRNFQHLLAGYAEMHRVIKSGGTLMVLELSTPTSSLVKPFYKFYTGYLIPMLGKLVSKDRRAYTYLPESIAAAPQGNDMAAIIEKAGFTDVLIEPLTFGVCTLYIAKA